MTVPKIEHWLAATASTQGSLEHLQNQYAGYCHALLPFLADTKKSPTTIYDFLATRPNTSEFIRLVDQNSQIKQLLQNAEFSSTAWAPSNTALQQLSNNEKLATEEDILAFLQAHISPCFLPVYFLLTAPTVDTSFYPDQLNGVQRITVRPSLNGLRVNSYATVIEQDNLVENGLVHVIDQVLLPHPSVESFLASLPPQEFGLFQSAVKRSKEIQVILQDKSRHGGTIFIPTNQAFHKLPEGVQTLLFSTEGTAYLQALVIYHIVPNQSLYSNRFYDQESTSENFMQTPEPTPDHTVPTPENQADYPWRVLKGVRQFPVLTCLKGRHLTVAISRYGGLVSMRVNESANVTVQDGLASDGVCHVVDSVLFPPQNTKVGEQNPVLSIEDVKLRLGQLEL